MSGSNGSEAGGFDIPTPAEEELRAHPAVIRAAEVIASLADGDPLVRGERLFAAETAAAAVDEAFGERRLAETVFLRRFSGSPAPLAEALAGLKQSAKDLEPPQRDKLFKALLPLAQARSPQKARRVVADLARSCGVEPPAAIHRDAEGRADLDGGVADRVWRLVKREQPLVIEALELARASNDAALERAIDLARREGDMTALQAEVHRALARAKDSAAGLLRALDDASRDADAADELERAGRVLESVARQRDFALLRRIEATKRHLTEDLRRLAEDAAAEYEIEARRATEHRRTLSQNELTDLDERFGKNVERRYAQLAQRYQEQLDLINTEVTEYCHEFLHARSDAVESASRRDFQQLAPQSALSVRAGNALDKASGRTLLVGAAGAAATGAAMQTGMVGTAAVLGIAATPVGVAALGVLALAGVWKLLASPKERAGRDLRQRALRAREALAAELEEKTAGYATALEAAARRYKATAIPQLGGIFAEADRLREATQIRRRLLAATHEAKIARVERLMPLLQAPDATN